MFRDLFMGTLGINFLFSRNVMKSGRVGKDWRERGGLGYEMRLGVGKSISAGLRQRVTGQKPAHHPLNESWLTHSESSHFQKASLCKAV